MPRRKLDPDEPHTAPQVTLRGRSAYAVLQLSAARGGEVADAARWIIDSWLGGEGQKILLDQYGIDVRAYRPKGNVLKLDRSSASTSNSRRR